MRKFSIPQTAGLVAGAVLVVLLVPTSVNAAGSTLTRITDGSGPVAKVDRSGRLAVGDGSGPLTVDGRVRVSSLPPVSGTVTARPSRAARPWMNVNGTSLSGSGPTALLYSGTVSSPLNLTTFSASANGAGPVTISAQVYVGSPPGDCTNLAGFGAAERFTIFVPANNTVVETFPSPMTWTQYGQPDDTFCVKLTGSGSSGWLVSILANGFLG